VERFGYDMNTLLAIGAIVEGDDTNYDRNPSGEGGRTGVIGSGGIVPDNYIVTAPGGITIELVSKLTINGIPSTRWRFSGTPTDNNPIRLDVEQSAELVNGLPNLQQLSASFYARLVSGNFNGVSSVTHWGELRDVRNAPVSGIPFTDIKPGVTATFQRFVETWITPAADSILS
jgi:hypothetical protein